MTVKINADIAKTIVKRATSILDYSINVMNEQGIIIASSDPKRLSQLHIGAVQALRKQQMIAIDENLACQWHHQVKPGINIPITYLGKAIGVVGISGNPQQVLSYAKLVKMTAELIIEQAILLENERWHHRYKESFILQLIDTQLDHQQKMTQAQFFQIDLNLPRIAVLIQLKQDSLAKLQLLMTYFAQPELNYLAAIHSQQTIILFIPANPKQKFQKLLPLTENPHHYYLAIGGYFEGIDGLIRSYQTANSVLEYGKQHFPKKQQYTFSDYKLPALLAPLLQSWQGNELTKTLEYLQQQDNKQMLYKTLRCYFKENCDLNRTSTQLFIHTNTLRYRLNKIEQLTGLSFNKIEEKFMLYLLTLTDH